MKLVCLGDSQTFCFGLRKPEKWTTLLAESSGIEVVNAGVCGDTTGGMLSRLKNDVFDQNPDAILIMGGGNDFICGCDLATVQANLMSIAMQSIASGIKVIMASEMRLYPDKVNPEFKKMVDFEAANSKFIAMIDWLEWFCGIYDFKFINLGNEYWEATGGDPKYSLDGLHPNAEGCKIIADIITRNLV